MTDTQPESRRRRRWFQVSVRTFLALMLLVSVGLGWLGTVIQRGREQRFAVLAFENLEGGVFYDYPGNLLQRNSWVRSVFGEDALSNVTSVTLNYTSVSDAELVHLKGLAHLNWLELTNTQVSDVGLVHLSELRQLRTLDLSGTQVSEAGLVHLKKMTQLNTLELNSTQVNDSGLVHLKGLTKLGLLNLSNTQVSNAELVHMQGLTDLESLALNNTQVSDAGLVHLNELMQLKHSSDLGGGNAAAESDSSAVHSSGIATLSHDLNSILSRSCYVTGTLLP